MSQFFSEKKFRCVVLVCVMKTFLLNTFVRIVLKKEIYSQCGAIFVHLRTNINRSDAAHNP